MNGRWDYQYLGKSVKNGYEYEYKLQTVSVDNLDVTSPFDYSVFPRALTVVKRPLKSAGNSLSSPLKQASYSIQRREEQQSFGDYEDERRLYAKLGIPSPDGLGSVLF